MASLKRLLDRQAGGPYALDRCTLESSRAGRVVIRLGVEANRSTAASMIVKCAAAPTPAVVRRVNHEIAAIRFVRSQSDAQVARIAPEIYGHDPRNGIAVIEDLAWSRSARSLHDLFCSAERGDAVECLKALACTLGRLHRLTLRSDDTKGRGTDDVANASYISQALTEGGGSFRRQLRRYGLRLRRHTAAELRSVYQLLHDERVVSFCHGDVSPKNVFISPSGIALCDFEFSGFQHPIMEGMLAGWLFPLSTESGSMPPALVDEVTALYNREFSPQLLRDYDAGRVRAAALIAFALFHWTYTVPEAGLPNELAGSRAKVLELTRLLRTAGTPAHFPLLSELLGQLGAAIQDEPALAPDAPLMYDCFVDRADTQRPFAPDVGRATRAIEVSGLFRVNRHCHLLITRNGGTSITVHVLEHPELYCDADPAGETAFQARSLPLRLECADYPRIVVRDLRTDKATSIERQRLPAAAVRHLASFLTILYHQHVSPDRRSTAVTRLPVIGH